MNTRTATVPGFGAEELADGYGLTLPYPPALNHLYATVGRRRILSAAGRSFKQTVGVICARVRPLAGDVEVRIGLYRPRRAGDIDGPLKILLDSLTGVAFVDDAQIVRLEVDRFDDKADPRVEVYVKRAEGGN